MHRSESQRWLVHAQHQERCTSAMRYLLFCATLLSAIAMANPKLDTLHFGVSISTSAQREAFYTMARRFEAENPGLKVEFKALTSEVYKEQFADFLQGRNQFDVLYWHAGERLFEYVDQGLITPINDLWVSQNLAQLFDQSIIDTLQRNDNLYALPISYYQIGFYYSKTLFEKHHLQEPQNWRDLMDICGALRSQGVPPIFIGTASNWPATAWFDYLNLRINGLNFHQQVTAGKIAFTDSRITQVLMTWREAITKGCFVSEHNTLDWKEGLPLLFRGLTGMSLIGNYVIQDIPASIVDDIGFFAFPTIDNTVPAYEEAPLDILVIPQSSGNKALAKRFLQFMSLAENQSKLNRMLGVISPHRLAQTQTSELVQEAYQVLSSAEGVSQFFDRDGKKAFADAIMPVFDQFALTGDVPGTQAELERIRTSVLSH